MASVVSSEYRDTSDAFKKKDLLEVLKPQIGAKLAEAKTSGRYLYVDFKPGDVSLDHYNVEKKAFPITGISLSNLLLTNVDAFKYLPMPDDDKARTVEAALTKGIAYDIGPGESSLAVPGGGVVG